MGNLSLIAGFTLGASLSAAVTFTTLKKNYAPRRAYTSVIADLNQDGVPDLIMERSNGHKIPLYGVRQGDNIRYFSASEMKRKDPNSIIDYETIESRLNKK